MFGCILRWRSVVYHIWVTVTLTFDLISRIIVYGVYPTLLEEYLVCWCILGWWCDAYQFWVTVTSLTLTSDLRLRIIVSRAYILHFSLPEPKAQGELLWLVFFRPASPVNFLFKWQFPEPLDQISNKFTPWCSLIKLHKRFCFTEQEGCQSSR